VAGGRSGAVGMSGQPVLTVEQIPIDQLRPDSGLTPVWPWSGPGLAPDRAQSIGERVGVGAGRGLGEKRRGGREIPVGAIR
jgi:hypothetical protein